MDTYAELAGVQLKYATEWLFPIFCPLRFLSTQVEQYRPAL